jgi:hypothetical protein
MSIILLRGFSHSGKDYIGQILCETYEYKRFAFADSLKKIVAKEFGCPCEQLHTQEGKLLVCEKDPLKRTYRQILIDEALRLRNIDTGVFAKHCCTEIYDYKPEKVPKKVVITDWRYPNEIEILKKSFPGYTITPVHIKREGQTKSPVDDISEHQLDDRCCDYQINNRLNETIFEEVKILIDFIAAKKEVDNESKVTYMGVFIL